MREAKAGGYVDPANCGGIGFEDMLEGASWGYAEDDMQTASAGYESWLQKGASDQEAADYFSGLLALATNERKREAQPQAGTSRQAPVLVD